MSRLRYGIVIALVVMLGVFAAGCGDDDDAAAPATTEATVPATTAPATTTEAETETEAETDTAAAAGDAAAGKTTFESTCQGCHPAGGTSAGAGPVLAGAGLTAEAIRTQIQTPRNAMPANLVSGTDLDNVVAYVESIQ